MKHAFLLATCWLLISPLDQAWALDTPRAQIELVRSRHHEFQIVMGGTLDGFNTRDPVFTSAPKQSFEPMRSVRIENVGAVEIINPWLLVNGRRNWRSASDIVNDVFRASGVPAQMTEEEKARALYEFVRSNRFHATPGDLEVRDPVKLFNVYGYGLCGDTAAVLMDLWRLAGLKTKRGFPAGHCTSEVWYGNAWHLLDADMSALYLDRDNATIAAGEQLARDHDLVRRAAWDETDAALYGYEGGLRGEYPARLDHAMRLRLRPGEALEWRWDHRGKHHQAARPLYALQSTHLKEHWGENAWEHLCNGRWIYAPDLRKASAAERSPAATNARWNRQLALPAVSPQAAGETATLVWKVETPYSLVGGELRVILRCRKGSSWALLFSYDNQDWIPLLSSSDRSETEVASSLDRFLPSQGPARYQYYLRIDLTAGRRATDVGLDGIVLQNDLQMARLSLPALELGDNKIVYSDETEEPHMVRVTYHWVERSGPPPPLPSAAPLFPEDGEEVEGSGLQFRWEKAQAGENAVIADYQFQLCAEPHCRWALSSRFDLLVSSVAGKPVAEHRLLNPGLLNPGQRYWWRVRAKSGLGVWSPWSKTWSFVPQGPGIPLGLKIVRQDGDALALEWERNPGGRRPARYLVYGSDEKGFSPSDSPQTVYVGNQKGRGLFPGRERVVFPPSLLVETQETRLQLRPIHAFYRVVAVDAKGNRSGPSDWAAAPRPFIYTDPVREAWVGIPYRYEARTIASIGHLTYRDFPLGEFYQAAFWEAEKPRFSLVDEISRCGNKDPSWLHVDPETGVLTGVPGEEDVGEYQINLKVEIEGIGADILSFPLSVGK